MENLIKNMIETIKKLNIGSLLVNGNMEKPLKFLMALNHDSKPNWYLMDKQFDICNVKDDIPWFLKNEKGGLKKKHEIDLILCNGKDIHSVAEFKCTFITDSKRAVDDAIKKAETTKYLALNGHDDFWRKINDSVEQYIVHFLLISDPRVVDGYVRPTWATTRYKVNDFQKKNIPLEKAVNDIVKAYDDRYSEKVKSITVVENKLVAIWVKVA
jgi:hypothetical protein